MAEADSMVGKGLVKEVQSGDCLTILTSGSPKQEIVLTLASLDAPRLSRRNGDAPFAQQSREFLRNLCAGKMVTFKVEYKVPTIGRTFGTVIIDGEDVSHSVVEAGFAAVKEARGSECSGSYDELVALQESAKAAGAGMWTSDKKKIAAASVRVRNAGDKDVSDDELAAIFAQIDDKPVEAIIEYVRDGSNMRVQLVDFAMVVPFSLAGVACPSFKGKGIKLADGSYDDSAAQPEPYAAMAKQFTETRLLSRRVNIRCQAGPKKVNTFFGKVEHPKGDISAEILKAGLGRISDWTLRYTPNRLALRTAQRQAQAAKRRIWKNYTPPSSEDLPAFNGRVVEVHSGDTLTVEDAKTGDATRVSLSSIRVPFGGTRDGAKKAEPFSFEARDTLRQLVIGKQVSVSVDYARRGRDKNGAERTDGNVRLSATVLVGKTNAALELVKRGFASVVRHRGDEPRSAAYDDLLEAEIKAEKARTGIHGDAKKAAAAPIDVTRDSQKAKQFMAFLTRPGEKIHQGVVDFCFNGSRFKVHVPKENCIVTVNLIGVATPRTARGARNGNPAEPAEPCAEEALQFVRNAVLNRTITLDIEDTDERGAALAVVFVNINGRRTNLNLELLKRGYARVVRWSADKSKMRGQFYDASDVARDSRIGIWENYTPKPRRGEGDEEDGADTSLVGTQRVRVSHIDDASSFYITLDNEAATTALAELQAAGPSLTPATEVKRKQIYAIDFDGEWSRVRVDAVTGGGGGAAAAADATEGEEGGGESEEAAAAEGGGAAKKETARADISYLDFGNKETAVPVAELFELPEALAKLPGAAVKAHLAFIKVPGLGKALGQAAGEQLNVLTWEKPLVAELLPADDNGVPVILFDAADADAVDKVPAAVTGGAEAAAVEGEVAAAEGSADAEAEGDAAAAAAATAAGADAGAADAADAPAPKAEKKVAPVSINELMVRAGLARVRRPRQRRGFGGRSPKPEAPKGAHAPLQKALIAQEEKAHKAHIGMWTYGDPGDSDDGPTF